MTTLPVSMQAGAAPFQELESPPLTFKPDMNMRRFPNAVVARHANMDGFWCLLSAQIRLLRLQWHSLDNKLIQSYPKWESLRQCAWYEDRTCWCLRHALMVAVECDGRARKQDLLVLS
jgi:hypothetical protein